MKILHISTGSKGGAHSASRRLARSQADKGHQVIFIDSDSDFQRHGMKEKFSFLVLRMLAAIVSKINRTFTQSGMYYLTPISVSRIKLDFIYKIKPDVVHIHNWFNLLSASEIEIISRDFPVVVTMHDERMITGGCHYTNGCEKYLVGCQSCPGSRIFTALPVIGFKETRNIFSTSKIGIITPSLWLFKKVENSIGTEVAYLTKINNIQEKTFSDYRKSNLNTNTKVFTFVAADPSNPAKGLKIILEALDLLSSSTNLEFKLNIVGKPMPEMRKTYEIQQHGFLKSHQIQQIFQKTDFTLVPSLQDNAPSVVIESIMTGTPVIGTKVGGIPEFVKDGISGFTSLPTVADFSNALLRALQLTAEENERLRFKTYEYAQEEFSTDQILIDIMQFYNTVIQGRGMSFQKKLL